MTELSQSHLFGETSDDSVNIQTSGRHIRPLLSLASALLDEMRVHVEDDRIHFQAADPANVGMIQLSAPAAGFDGYELTGDGFDVAFNVNSFQSELERARKGKATDDAVSLNLSESRSLITTQREYDITTVTQTGEVLNIDPQTVRSDSNIPDIDLACSATVDVDALQSVIEHANRLGGHVELTNADGHLRVNAHGADQDHAADFGPVVEPYDGSMDGGETSLYSNDYFMDMANALSTALVDSVTLVWADTFPLQLRFERTDSDGQVLYEGAFLLAPRVKE